MMPCFFPSHSPSDRGLTCKLIYLLPDNTAKRGLPTLCVFVLAFDPDTGAIRALMVLRVCE